MGKISYNMLENFIEDSSCKDILEEYGIFDNDGILVDFRNTITHDKINQIMSSIYLDFNESIRAWYFFSNKVRGVEVNCLDPHNPVMSAYYALTYNNGNCINNSQRGEENFFNFKKAVLTGKEKYALGNLSDTYPFQIKKYPDGTIKHSVVGKSIIVSMSYDLRENYLNFEVDGLDIPTIRIDLTPMSAALYKLFCKKNRRIQLRNILDKEEIFEELCDIYKFSEKVSDTKVKTLQKKKQTSDTHYIGNRISDLNKELDNLCVHSAFKLERDEKDYYYIPILQTEKVVVEK